MTAILKEKLQSLLTKRNGIFERVQCNYDLMAGLNQNNVSAFLVRYEKLDDYHSSFEKILDDINEVSLKLDPADKVDPSSSKFSLKAMDDLYFSIRAFARDQNISGSTSGPSLQLAKPSAKLPKLQLPTFSGDLKDWPNFYSLFNSTIHSQTNITGTEKLQYLRTFLTGTPLALIEHLHLSDDNYMLAYNLLYKRYQHKRSLAAYYFNHILEFTPLQKCSVDGLRKHLEVFQSNTAAITELKLPNVSDFFLFHFAFLSLDTESRQLFENKTTDIDVPTFDNLMSFVQDQVKVLEISQQQLPKAGSSKGSDSRQTQKLVSYSGGGYRQNSFVSTTQQSNNSQPRSQTHNSSVQCPYCNQAHPLHHCPKFSAKSVPERQDIVRNLQKCFNCLNNHHVRTCQSHSRCRHCNKAHHTLLHVNPQSSSNPHSVPRSESLLTSHNVPSTSETTESLSCQSSVHPANSTILLGTAQAFILDNFDSKHSIRLVIDPGSMVSCITESCAQSLGLPRRASNIGISGIGNSSISGNKGIVSCTLGSSLTPSVQIHASAIILPRISSDLPTVPISKEVVKSFSSLKLADPNFHTSGKIDFLLGADIYSQILVTHGPTVIPGEPTAFNSIFGWVLLGKAATDMTSAPLTSLFTSTPPLDTLVRQFWEIEEVDFKKPQDPDDIFCENHFSKTHSRDDTGRYIVRLPFKSSEPICNNRKNALKQYENLQRRLSSKPEVQEEYQKFFRDYYESGHMTPANSDSTYVIPHHPVFKSSSSSTKVRAVFNASHVIPPGSSLNQVLHKGPKLQHDISCVITLFRKHLIPVCCDLKQMYRQVLLHPDDRFRQHIFWKPDEGSSVVEFELNTVTYGLSPSAFQAQRVIKQLTIDHGNEYPLASNSIQTGIYIDDVITGADSPQQALDLQQQLICLFQKGGFELRKWTSNCQAVLNAVPNDHLEVPLTIDADDQHTFKILGLYWDSSSDSFGYSTAMIDPIFTKRALLSNIARIFDPMGWLAPLIFWAKHLLQLLWKDNYDWDQPLSPDYVSSWNHFISQLSLLKDVRIPRYILHSQSHQVELLGFCDSSSKGYAAVLYLRVKHNDTYKVSLLKAKSKVAPSKNLLSIPRLELCAAVLLTRLVLSVSSLFSQLNIESIHLFSDSTIVLCWLKTPPHLLEVFVANRVVEILRSTTVQQWFHVSTEVNPADCASRGLLPDQIVQHHLWWNGPSFLSLPKEKWPLQPTVLTESLPGLKAIRVNTLISSSPEINPLYDQLKKFSSFTRTQRVLAYVLRFIENLKRSKTRTTLVKSPLLIEEIDSATVVCVRLVQQTHFREIISQLKKNNQTPVKGNLSSLTPFLDKMGLLRVGGRLKHAPLSYNSKHPLLLPANTHLSGLICDHFHRKSLHGGPRLVQSLIQQKYWIISLRNMVRHRIHKCVTCLRFSAKPTQPIMGDLPSDRFSQVRAFYKVGVDFGGPFSIKEHTRRNAKCTKGYLCLFVCLSTKAVHLELVSDLTTPAFLAAFERFVARRGLPSDIYSDNGTNLYGGYRQLQELYKFIQRNNPELHDHFTANKIKWHFNPPSASNFGGLFEAGIKSAKHHLKRVVADRALTFCEAQTLFCRIEQVLNSRPLVDSSVDPHDLHDFLTPGHFLIGAPLLSTPEEDVSQIPMNRLSRWKLVQQQLQSFWKLWHRDYLHALIKRPKWDRITSNVKLNDVVFLRNQSSSPLDWPLGRVVDVFPGPDGVVRVVQIRTAKSVLTRPVNKLLIVHSSQSE
uniref:Integrase catalytic domain-containing protein n=2 Tax=Cacopsylla melanoneura TaxID=428564 RepID=A0A8D9DS55_9HEMI